MKSSITSPIKKQPDNNKIFDTPSKDNVELCRNSSCIVSQECATDTNYYSTLCSMIGVSTIVGGCLTCSPIAMSIGSLIACPSYITLVITSTRKKVNTEETDTLIENDDNIQYNTAEQETTFTDSEIIITNPLR